MPLYNKLLWDVWPAVMFGIHFIHNWPIHWMWVFQHHRSKIAIKRKFIFHFSFQRPICIEKNAVPTIHWDVTLVMFHQELVSLVHWQFHMCKVQFISILHSLTYELIRRHWQTSCRLFRSEFSTWRHPKCSGPIDCNFWTRLFRWTFCVRKHRTRSWHHQIHKSTETTEIRCVNICQNSKREFLIIA